MGKADQPLEGKPADGVITFAELSAYVANNTCSHVYDKYKFRQSPELRGDYDLNLPLARVTTASLIANSLGMKLKLIPAGEFLMGSPESEKPRIDGESPQHRVRITRPFYLGIHEVTRGQFASFVRDKNYRTEAERDGKGGFGADNQGQWKQTPEYSWQNPGFTQTDDHPVVNLTWNDAVAFCEWLSRKEAKNYRLPTEAEWEYACRSGTTTMYQHGNDPEELAQVGNVAHGTAKGKFSKWRTISAKDGYVFTAPVGQFKANQFGLFDMHGNVWEWCSDWYDVKYYATPPVNDPAGASSGTTRVFRGGCWLNNAFSCRSAHRSWNVPSNRNFLLGFRVALSLSGESGKPTSLGQ